MAEPIDFPAFVRAELSARGWSQAELARRSGVSPPQIHHFLAESRDVTGKTLARLLAALDADVTVRRTETDR